MARDFDSEIQDLYDKIAALEDEKAKAAEAEKYSVENAFECSLKFSAGVFSCIEALSMVLPEKQVKAVEETILNPELISFCMMVAEASQKEDGKPLIDMLKAINKAMSETIDEMGTKLGISEEDALEEFRKLSEKKEKDKGTDKIKVKIVDANQSLDDILSDFLKEIGV